MKLFNINISAIMLGLIALQTQNAKAAVIAVVDSGTDVQHVELAQKIWNNPGDADDAVDNDNNGYIDDIHGWNFADNDDRLMNRKLIGTFGKDDYTYFDLQTKALRGEATADDIAWLRAKVADSSFLAELERFANFLHGTHVAGISSRNADEAQIMTLRLIGGGDSSKLSFQNSFARLLEEQQGSKASDGNKDKLIRLGLQALAAAQGKGLEAVGKYIASEKARVANCSFGTSRAAIEPLIRPLIEKIMGAPITDDQLHAYADFFLTQTAAAMKKSFTDPAKDTLFVIAAGNDGTNNDVAPTAPANIRADNTITVAATLDTSKLAVFSNYGNTTVDVAAPGVGILSTIPGNEHLTVSGTSQAAPYVTQIAGKIIDANPKLTVAQVKQVVLQTVDQKAFLAGKVSTGGIANLDRAVRAAKLSLTMPLGNAIQQSHHDVADMAETREPMNVSAAAAQFVLPLPSFLR